jgi:glycosyltransferase involved in cell wall biosynthesis
VARIASQKNQLWAIESLRHIRANDPTVHWVFVGPVNDEVYYQKVRAAVKAQGLEHCAHFLGGFPSGDPRLADAYHAADLFVLPSIHEPFGIVILEAWAAGCPVLASRVGGIPHFVDDGIDGFLFDPNDPHDLAKRFCSLDCSRLRESAERGMEKVLREYTWDVVTARLLDIYSMVLDLPVNMEDC